MKLRATIATEITINESDDLKEAQEKVIQHLLETLDDWVTGEADPYIELRYIHEDEYKDKQTIIVN
ncbi:hypothetical protein [uncultured Winogradskyella sp.]|uniref:hypothetical protein n=1 Tax=uncultured Winogradskyella sp. TaxID=395353 RepID=UPI0030ED1262|tara:strand:+ start:111 stop:308 length:198 start_codon:yes stop_codon:yes gene_type:complete